MNKQLLIAAAVALALAGCGKDDSKKGAPAATTPPATEKKAEVKKDEPKKDEAPKDPPKPGK